MLYRDLLIGTYAVLALLHYLFDATVTAKTKKNEKNATNQDDVIDKAKTTTKPRDIVQSLMSFLVIVTALLLSLIYPAKPIKFIFSLLSFSLWIGVLPYSISGFIEYVFIKPLDYELTKEREKILTFIGFAMLLVCSEISLESRIIQIKHWLAGVKPVVADVSLMAGFTFWYFTVSFFILYYVVLSLHKIVVLINSKFNLKDITTPKKHIKKLTRRFSLAQSVANRIDSLTQKKKWKKIGYYFLWFICSLVDGLIIPIQVIIKNLTIACLFSLQILILPGFRKLFIALGKNQGKSIIIISRVLLVGSLLFVYLIDKYMKLFSAQGSEIYEFMCSVFIIPFLITQLIEIRRKKKNITCKPVED